MAILSKASKPGNFELHNSRLNFVDCESGNFSVRGYLPLIRKDYFSDLYGLAVYVKEGLPLHGTHL